MLAASGIAISLLVGAAHPHLFFQASGVPGLRAKRATTHQEIASHFEQVLAQHFNDPAPLPTDYDQSADPRLFGQDVCAWAFGYQLTGDARYAAQAQLRLKTYLGWTDWGFGEGAPDLNLGHFLIGVSCAYDLAYDYFSASDRAAIAARLGTEAQRMYDGWPSAWYAAQYPQNHNWINGAGLGLAGLALEGEDARAASWLARAKDDLAKVNGVLAGISDGSWHEGIAYQDYGLAIALPFWMALARAGSDFTDMGLLRGIGKMFLAATIPDAPRNQILLHGDFTGWPDDGMLQILRFSAARFGDGLAEAAAQRWLKGGARTHLLGNLFYTAFELLAYDPAVAAADPHTLPLDTNLADLQAAILHSTWDAGDLVLAFKAGPYGGRANFDRMKAGGGASGGHLDWGHDHNDDMSFWLWGSGTWLAPEAAGYDAGRNTGFALDKRANMTSFHNGVLVDGNGQLGDLRTWDDEVGNESWFYERDAIPLLTPTGTADYAFAGGRGASLYPKNVGLTRWDRLVVLARQRYALVRDDLEASAAHAFDWTCHFLDGANPDAASGWVQGLARNGMYLGVRMVSPASWTATTGTQSANLTRLFEPDTKIEWVRVRPSAAAATVQFLAALIPVQISAWLSRVRIDPLAAGDEAAGAVIAPGSALEERWIFGRPGTDVKAAGDLTLTGSLAGMVARKAGNPLRAVLLGPGSIADQNGARLLLASSSARTIEADLQGGTLVVSGDDIGDFQAYAPDVVTVKVNGRTVATRSSGAMLQYSAAAFPPVVTITTSPATPTRETAATFAFTSTALGSTFSCKLDSNAATACTSPASYVGLAAGLHSFVVSATDAAGVSSAQVSSSWMIEGSGTVASLHAGGCATGGAPAAALLASLLAAARAFGRRRRQAP